MRKVAFEFETNRVSVWQPAASTIEQQQVVLAAVRNSFPVRACVCELHV